MARRTLTDKSIAALKVSKRTSIPDPKLAGHYLRVTPNGVKTFVAVARDPRGKQIWHTIGTADAYTLDQARDLARNAMKAIKAGEDRAGPQSFQAIAEEWFKRHVEAKQLRTAARIRRDIELHVLPSWGGRDFASIKRIDVAKLLDHIEDRSGPVAADKVMAHLGSIFNWYAARHGEFISPLVVKGMKRSKPTERARERILSDSEIRAVWEAANGGTFGALVKLLLLTAQRREKVAAMRWADISLDGTWSIPAEAREKGNARDLVLPEMALDIIKAQPRLVSNPFVFAGRGGSHYSGYSKGKAALDAKLPDMPQWGLHDLRRSARSLMSRAGIAPHVAELTLGHVQKGVAAIYDRHSYRDEKRHALAALASLVSSIVNPIDNVVPLAENG